MLEKMAHIKRLAAGLMAFLVVTVSLPFGSMEARAETYGDYWYYVQEDGTVQISRYNGNEENVVIPSEIDGKKVTRLEGTFANYTGSSTVKSVMIPKSVTVIGWGAFQGCSNLESVTIPESVTRIEGQAFYGCGSLTELLIPDGVTDVGSSAFYGCENLKSLTIPESVVEIGSGAFSGTKWLEDRQKENPLVIVNHLLVDGTACSGDVAIPDSVTAVVVNAFYHCREITGITIPSSVSELGRNAFAYCENLERVKMEDGILSIAEGAFDGCKKLSELALPDSVASIGTNAFRDCSSLTDIAIPTRMTVINGGIFSGCSSLTDVIIPSGITNVGDGAFSGCGSLENIEIPDTVTSIGRGAFSGTKWLEKKQKENPLVVINHILFDGTACSGNVTIPAGVEIGSGAFYGCTSLTGVTIPEGVEKIGTLAFYGCSGLENVILPSSITSVGSVAFSGTKWLEDRQKENPLVVAGHIVIDATTCIGSVAIPEGVSLIADNAFSGYRNEDGYMMSNRITDITFPDSMADIGAYVFQSCASLKSVTVPSSVKSIGREAFGYFLNPENYYKIDGFVIYGESGTAAEQYAKENGFEFRLLSENGASQGGVSQIDISKAEVTLEKESYAYDGKAKVPSVTVNLDGKTLALNTDYTVSYSNNVSVGTAKVTVTGKGRYKGSVTKTFSINKASQGIICKKTVYNVAYGAKPFTIQASADSALTYESSDKKVASVDKNGKVTVKGTGIVYITVKSGSNSLKVTVKASPKKQTVKSAQAKGRKLAVKWKRDKMATGYQIQISGSKKFKKVIKTIKTSKNTCTFTKLKAGSRYYVRLRSYKKSGKEMLCGAWSSPKRSGKVKK